MRSLRPKTVAPAGGKHDRGGRPTPSASHGSGRGGQTAMDDVRSLDRRGPGQRSARPGRRPRPTSRRSIPRIGEGTQREQPTAKWRLRALASTHAAGLRIRCGNPETHATQATEASPPNRQGSMVRKVIGSGRSRRVMAELNVRVGRGPRGEGFSRGPTCGPTQGVRGRARASETAVDDRGMASAAGRRARDYE